MIAPKVLAANFGGGMAKAFCCSLLGAVGLVSALWAGPAAAQDASEAQLDALIEATQSDAGALAAARRQTGAGDLTGAAATLERSLLLRSGTESDDVRLYYGTVLYRLGDLRRGAYQLANVRTVGAGGWAEAREACREAPPADAAPRGDSLAGVVTVGLGYESDALGALLNQLEIPGLPAPTEEGVAVIATANLSARFASQLAGHGYAGLSAQATADVSGPDTDYQSISARLGYAWRLRGVDRELSTGIVGRYARLDGDDLVTEWGVQIELADDVGAAGRWAVRLEASNQDYHTAGLDPLRDGPHYDAMFTYRHTSAVNRTWAVGGAVEYKEAEWDLASYVGGRVFAASRHALGEEGAYLATSGMLRYRDYRDPAFVPGQTETRTYVRAAVGIPVTRQGLYVEGAVTYSARWYDNASGLYDYSSFGVEARLVYRFGHSWSAE